MSEKQYTKEEAVDTLIEHTVAMMDGVSVRFEKNKAHGLAVGTALLQICQLPSGAIISVDMEATR